MSRKKNVALQSKAREYGTNVFELRDYLVMLVADVVEIFNVETREIVQNIKRNNVGIRPLFPERYAFQINKQELPHLRSLEVISKPGRGGYRFKSLDNKTPFTLFSKRKFVNPIPE